MDIKFTGYKRRQVTSKRQKFLTEGTYLNIIKDIYCTTEQFVQE